MTVDGVSPDFYCVFNPYYDDNGVADYQFDTLILAANLSSNDGAEVKCENVAIGVIDFDVHKEAIKLSFWERISPFLFDGILSCHH